MHTQHTNPDHQVNRDGFLDLSQAQWPAKKPIYLALDFDGVLHHIFCSPPRDLCIARGKGEIDLLQFVKQLPVYGPAGYIFDRAHELVDCLDRLDADVRIVIATGWRHFLPLEDIMDLMPARLASRVAGALDRMPESDAENRALPGERRKAMERWMDANAQGARWIAIDDNPTHWEGHDGRLFQTQLYGLYGEETIAALDEWLLEAIDTST